MLVISFFLGVSFTMMKFRATVERPKINKREKQKIDELGNRLKEHVTALAGAIGERNLFIPENLHKAAYYIHTFWQNLGDEVKKQAFLVEGLSCENLSIEIPGKERPEEIILLGAHYDSVVGSPGANDNGSAVASLLEISRLFGLKPQKKTVRLVAFTNEEPPFFQKKSMGSRVCAQRCREQKEKIVAMVRLQTIRYYSEVPKSQNILRRLIFFILIRVIFWVWLATFSRENSLKLLPNILWKGLTFPLNVWQLSALFLASRGQTIAPSGSMAIRPLW